MTTSSNEHGANTASIRPNGCTFYKFDDFDGYDPKEALTACLDAHVDEDPEGSIEEGDDWDGQDGWDDSQDDPEPTQVVDRIQIEVGPAKRISKLRLIKLTDPETGSTYSECLCLENPYTLQTWLRIVAQCFGSPDIAWLESTIHEQAKVADDREKLLRTLPELEVISGRDILSNASSLRPEEIIVGGALLREHPTYIAGEQKSLKTTLMMDLALSIASGNPFLGRLEIRQPLPVTFFSAESGSTILRETAARPAAAKGIGPRSLQHFRLVPSIPALDDDAGILQIERFAAECAGGVMAFDPVFKALVRTNTSVLANVGAVMFKVSEVLKPFRVTPIFLHHITKGAGCRPSPPTLADLSGAGFGEHARGWLLVYRREQFRPGNVEHRLAIDVGNCAGYSARWHLDVKEGEYGKRIWQAELLTVDESAERSVERAKESIVADQHKVLKALAALPEGETRRQLRTLSGMPTIRLNQAIEALLAASKIVDCSLKKGNRNKAYEAYRLVDQQPPKSSYGESGESSG